MTNKTYGTVSAEQQNAMTGLEFVQGLANGTLPLNTIAQTLGYDIVEAEDGRVVITVEPRDSRPQSGRHGAWRARRHPARQVVADSRALDPGQRHQLHDPRVQDIVHAPDHAADWRDQGRGLGDQFGPPRRHRRRPDHRPPRAAFSSTVRRPALSSRAELLAGLDGVLDGLGLEAEFVDHPAPIAANGDHVKDHVAVPAACLGVADR